MAAQWNRCICATQSDWVWLFSDDDIAATDCVAGFYEALANPAPPSDVYRFQSWFIDEAGRVLRELPKDPPFESAAELALCRMPSPIGNFCPKPYFSRGSFERCGGMVEFPCGFFSDDASFAGMGKRTGIISLPRVTGLLAQKYCQPLQRLASRVGGSKTQCLHPISLLGGAGVSRC